MATPRRWSGSRRDPGFAPLRLVVALLVGAVAVWVVSVLLAGVHVNSFLGAIEVAALIGVLNAVLPPIVAAVRLPFTLVSGFLIVLAVDAGILLIISAIDPADFKVDSFGDALLAALLISAASLVLQVILGVDDDDAYSLRVIARVARRQGPRIRTDGPGIVFLEIDGLAAPVLRRAMRDGNTPVMARWLGRRQPRPARMGDRPVVADRRQPGRDSARLQPRHSRVSVGREGNRQVDDLLGAG